MNRLRPEWRFASGLQSARGGIHPAWGRPSGLLPAAGLTPAVWLSLARPGGASLLCVGRAPPAASSRIDVSDHSGPDLHPPGVPGLFDRRQYGNPVRPLKVSGPFLTPGDRRLSTCPCCGVVRNQSHPRATPNPRPEKEVRNAPMFLVEGTLRAFVQRCRPNKTGRRCRGRMWHRPAAASAEFSERHVSRVRHRT